MGLFQRGEFTLASGAKSQRKIECDALTQEDWDALAAMAVEFLPPFSVTVGVPRGGIPFAQALQPYQTLEASTILVCEDVVTTGGSIAQYRKQLEEVYPNPFKYLGVCVFARGKCPDWVTPLFQMPIKRRRS